jgi:hypothetical protein
MKATWQREETGGRPVLDGMDNIRSQRAGKTVRRANQEQISLPLAPARCSDT